MLLQKSSKFQNILFTTFTPFELQNFTILVTYFWPSFQSSFFFVKNLLYYRSFLIEQVSNSSVQAYVHSRYKAFGAKWLPLQAKSLHFGRRKVLSSALCSTPLLHPRFSWYRQLFLTNSLKFRRFWVQRRYRFRSFLVSEVTLPSTQLVQRRRKKKFISMRRKAQKFFARRLKLFFYKVRSFWKTHNRIRNLRPKKVRKLLNSPYFRTTILRKFLKNYLLFQENHKILFKPNFSLSRGLEELCKNISFFKTLLRVIRSYTSNSLRRRRPFRSFYFESTLGLKNSNKLTLLKPFFFKSTWEKSRPLRELVAIKSSSDVTARSITSFELRQFTYRMLLNFVSTREASFEDQEVRSRNLKTVRGGRFKTPRLPRMTNYFSLKSRRFETGLLTPPFLTLLKRVSRKPSPKSINSYVFKHISNSKAFLNKKQVYSNNHHKNSRTLRPNRLLTKKIFKNKNTKRSLYSNRPLFAKKPRFRKLFYDKVRGADLRSKTFYSFLRKARGWQNSFLRNKASYKKVLKPTILGSKTLVDNVTHCLRSGFWGIDQNKKYFLGVQPSTELNLSKGIQTTSNLKALKYTQRYKSFFYLLKRQRRVPRWKKLKRRWYTLRNKTEKMHTFNKKRGSFPRQSTLNSWSFKNLKYFYFSKQRRNLLFKKPHTLRRRLKALNLVIRKTFHHQSFLGCDSYTRVLTKRRKYRRRWLARRRKMRTVFWVHRYHQVLNSRTNFLKKSRAMWLYNTLNFNLSLPWVRKNSFKLEFTHSYSSFLNRANLTSKVQKFPEFLSFANKSFILSEVGFLYIEPFKLDVSTRNFSSLKSIKYSFYDLMFLKRSILKSKRPTFFLDTPLDGNNPLQQTLTRFSSNLTPLKDFMTHSQTHLNMLNVSFDSLLTHEFDVNHLEGEDDYYIRVKRIRFKPGYPRLWREARSDFNKLFSLNFRYQHRLTQYLVRYSRHSSSFKSQFLDLKVKTLLLRVWWTFDPITSLDMINNNLVFLNGSLVANPNQLLFKGDFIQLIVHLKYYIIHRWLLNWYYFKSARKARLARSKFKRVQQAQMKQKSFILPNWLLRMHITDLEIPRFVEVDFFSLSTLVLYNPQYGLDYQLIDTLNSRFEIYTMYNWKYIN